jgi:hypothetical protein
VAWTGVTEPSKAIRRVARALLEYATTGIWKLFWER